MDYYPVCTKYYSVCMDNYSVCTDYYFVCTGYKSVHTEYLFLNECPKHTTVVKLLSLKRQKIGMIHFNCFQPRHMTTYVLGARKPVSRDFSFEHQKYKGSVACRSAFFFKTLLSGQVSFILFAYRL